MGGRRRGEGGREERGRGRGEGKEEGGERRREGREGGKGEKRGGGEGRGEGGGEEEGGERASKTIDARGGGGGERGGEGDVAESSNSLLSLIRRFHRRMRGVGGTTIKLALRLVFQTLVAIAHAQFEVQAGAIGCKLHCLLEFSLGIFQLLQLGVRTPQFLVDLRVSGSQLRRFQQVR